MAASFDHIQVYRDELDRFKLGHALWRPVSKDDHGEIDIGDVGYLTNGTFKRMFSVVHPEECDDVPLARKLPPLDDLSSITSRFTERCIEQSVLCSPSGIAQPPTWNEKITMGDVIIMSPSTESLSGAALFVDPDARREVLKPLQDQRLRNYIGKHSNDLTRFANKNGLRGGVLILTGWVKTSAWASTAFQSRETFAGSVRASVRFESRSEPQWTAHRVEGTLFRSRSGPSRETAPSDQCIFISYYLLTSRLLFFKSLKASAGPDNQPERDRDDDTLPPSIRSEERQPPEPLQFHDPRLAAVVEYIFDSPDVDFAIVSESAAHKLISSDNARPLDFLAYLKERKPSIVVDGHGVGALEDDLPGDREVGEKLQEAQLLEAPPHIPIQPAEPSPPGQNGSSAGDNIHPPRPHEGRSFEDPWMQFTVQNGPSRRTAYSTTESKIVYALENHNIRLCEKAGKVVVDLEGHTHTVLSLMLSLDEGLLLSASEDGEVIIWNLRARKMLKRFRVQSDVHYAVFSPDTDTIAAVADDGVHLWSKDGKLTRTLPCYNGPATWGASTPLVFFLRDNQLLLSCVAGVGTLWDRLNGEHADRKLVHESDICGARSLPCDLLKTYSMTDILCVWDVRKCISPQADSASGADNTEEADQTRPPCDIFPSPLCLSVTAARRRDDRGQSGAQSYGIAHTYDGVYYASPAVFAGLKLETALAHLRPPSTTPRPPTTVDEAPVGEYVRHYESFASGPSAAGIAVQSAM